MHSPIRRQLTLVVLCTNLLGLGIVYATFELYERTSFRRTLTGELSVLADTVAANSHVPLAFHEQKWAQDVLEELGAERRIMAASLYTTDGKVLAEYRRAGTSPDFLVAEDNLVNQRLVVRLLEKRGHRVVVAANGKEALAALERESFDIILMDVQMPEMDGFEATAAVRKKEKSNGLHQAIVALTAHAMKGDREKCLAAGMDAYLSKPIRPQELDEVLARYAARPQVTA